MNRCFASYFLRSRRHKRGLLPTCVVWRSDCFESIVQNSNSLGCSFDRNRRHHNFGSLRVVRFFSTGGSRHHNQREDPSSSIWTQLQSPPNILTLTRMASTPILAYWIVSENYNLAIYGCGLAAVSDFLDGYLAKHYGWSTVVGTYLDPLADKILINFLGISLWYSSLLPTPLIVVWAAKDAILLSGTAWYVYQEHQSIDIFRTSVTQKPLKVTPSSVAKMNTALQFATLFTALISPVTNTAFVPVLLNNLW